MKLRSINMENNSKFSPEYHRHHIEKWIEYWFKNLSGNAQNAVIGMSGGKDSTICAALCAEAIGVHRVIGVLMPTETLDDDYRDAVRACEAIGIRYYTINIKRLITEFDISMFGGYGLLSEHTWTNVLPRIRMSILYAIAQETHGRVCGTTNACEAFLGYCTKGGDTVCDFAPIKNYTVDELYAIGDTFENIPSDLIHKAPADGLTGKTDEENMGISYSRVGALIRYAFPEKEDKKIYTLHFYSKHKFAEVPSCKFVSNDQIPKSYKQKENG